MVKREKVTDPEGRRWISGLLDSRTYFEQVRRTEQERARRTVAARLDRAGRQPAVSRG